MSDKSEKTVKPSQRKSVTPFSKFYGGKTDLDSRIKRKKLLTTIFTVIMIIFFIYLGYFLADTLIKITEMV